MFTMKLLAPCRVVLFVCALLVLFFSFIIVETHGNTMHMEKEIMHDGIKGNEIKEVAQKVATEKQEVAEFYTKFNSSVTKFLEMINSVIKHISEIKEINIGKLEKEQSEDRQEAFKELKEQLNKNNDELGKLKQDVTTLNNEQQKIKKIINDSIENIEKLKIFITNVQGDKNEIAVEKADNLHKLATETKSLFEKILGETEKHFKAVLKFVESINQTKHNVEETIKLFLEKNKDKEINDALQEIKKQLSQSVDEANQIPTAFKEPQEDITKLIQLCEQCAKEANELAQTITTAEKEKNFKELNNDIISGQNNNGDNGATTQLLTEQEKHAEQNDDLLRQKDIQAEKQQNLQEEKKEKEIEEEEIFTNKEKQKQEKGTVSSGGSSCVVVTQFIIIFVFTVLSAWYL